MDGYIKINIYQALTNKSLTRLTAVIDYFLAYSCVYLNYDTSTHYSSFHILQEHKHKINTQHVKFKHQQETNTKLVKTQNNVCMYVYMYVCMYVYMYVCMYVGYMYICSVYVSVYVCICVCLYVCMHI